MTHLSPRERVPAIDGPPDEDLGPWCQAVRRASAAVGIIRLPSTRFVELSRYAQELIGASSGVGLDLLSPEARVQAAAITNAAASGAIDGSEARRRRWHRTDGSFVEVTVRGRAIRLRGGATYGLFVARDLHRSGPGPVSDLVGDDALGWRPRDRSLDACAVATLDRRWRVRGLSGDTGLLGDALCHDVAVSAATEPDDVARLLFAFAGATTQGDASTRLRLCSPGEPVIVDVDVVRLAGGSWRLAFTPVHRPDLRDGAASRRVTELAGALRRIATELQGAADGTAPARPHDVLRVPGVAELPNRQREIVVRLARGERVGTIATKMYLSANTVRNHLSAVFRKFGVHSQQELLAVLRGEDGDESTGVP